MTHDESSHPPQSAIRQYREDRGLTLEAFGALFEPSVDKTTVRYWERAGVPADRIIQIETVTGIPRQKLRPELYDFAEGNAA